MSDHIPNSYKGDVPPPVWRGEPLVPPVTFALGAKVRHETHGDGVVIGVGVTYNDVTMGRYTLGTDPTPIPKVIVAFDHVRSFSGNELYELDA